MHLPRAAFLPWGESVLDLVSRAVRERATEIGSEFRAAQPFPHVVVDGFLEPVFLEALKSEFPRFDEKKALNEFGEVGGKAVQEHLPTLGPAYAMLDRLLQSKDFLALMGDLTGIPHLLYDPGYVGGGTHENRHGQDLDMHIDFNYHPTEKWHRRLNLILFLNPEWDENWGGCLELQRDPWNPEDPVVVSAAPLENRCVVFETSERSWHGFRRIEIPESRRAEISRRSIAVYFYTHERPPEEVKPSHATVYVPRHMPAHIREGHTLSAADMAVIRDLFTRRDMHMRFLYEREHEFSAALESLYQSRPFRLGSTLLAPARMLKKLLKRS
jgi:Rps23 Pro-64 3,4-dihydroxylase Tpa1-like proline 4-hydroxylase